MTCDKKGCDKEATHEAIGWAQSARTCSEHLDEARDALQAVMVVSPPSNAFGLWDGEPEVAK